MSNAELVPLANAGLPEKIEYATELAKSELLPKQYRDKPANILLVMEFGEYLGLPPVAALRLIHIIDNKPVASAELISGRVRIAGHRLRVCYDPEKKAATCSIWRADDPGFEFRAEWTWDHANAVRDSNGNALTSKANWRNYYPAMLKWRAVTECARDACPEILLGVSYTAEELGVQELADEEADELGVMTRHQRVEHAELRRSVKDDQPRAERLHEPDPDDPWTEPEPAAGDDTQPEAATTPGSPAAADPRGAAPPPPQAASTNALERLDKLVRQIDLGPDEDVRACFEWVTGEPWTATKRQVSQCTAWLEDHLQAADGDVAVAADAAWKQYKKANPQAGDDGA